MTQTMEHLDYVQIGGNFKTGTSLLSTLLDHHPEIASFPIETANFGHLYPLLREHDVNKETKVNLIVRRCKKGGDKFAKDIPFQYAQIGQRFRQLTVTLSNDFRQLHYAFLQAFYDVFAPQHLQTARIWVDKSPMSHLFADDIFRLFPSAKFIHLLRDPKDNFASIGVKFLARKRGRMAIEALLWRYRIWSSQSFYYARVNQKKFGEARYKILRFEDLCLRPKEIVPELCDFLGIVETENLYRPTIAGVPYPGNNWEGEVFDGIIAGNVDNWQARIPSYYAQVMENQPVNTLRNFDYDLFFNKRQHTRALRIHRILTSFIPRTKLLFERKWPRELYQQPDSGVPGI